MTQFWLAAVVLTIISVLAALRPFLTRKKQEAVTRREYNQAVFSDRLNELQVEKEGKYLSDEEFTQLKVQLQKSLLDDIPAEKLDAQFKAGPSSPLLTGLIVLLVLGFSLSLYASIGGGEQLKEWYAISQNPDLNEEKLNKLLTQPRSSTEKERYTAGEYILAQRTRVHENPEYTQGWLTLAKTYLAVGHRQGVEDTLKRVSKLAPDDVDVLMTQGQLYQQLDGHSGRAKPALLRVLAKDSQHQGALMMLAVVEAKEGRKDSSVTYWKTLKSTLSADNQAIPMIDSNIKKLETELAAASSSRKIAVTVSFDKRFEGKYADSDTVFVFAKMANNASPMPLAVQKTTVGALKKAVILDETKAMMPALSIAKFDEVTLVARVSKSGNAKGNIGDLEGQLEKVTLSQGETRVNLVIDSVFGHGDKASHATPYGKMPEKGEDKVLSHKASNTHKASITVSVSINDGMRTKVASHDKVFIYAKAVSGPPMPLAIKTAKVSDLPVTVTLTDKDAMAPAFRLSSVQEVQVYARVSKSGNAKAQSGDIQGLSSKINLLEKKHRINIEMDHIIK